MQTPRFTHIIDDQKNENESIFENVEPMTKDQNFVSKGRFSGLGNGNVSETRWKQRKNGKYKETFGNIT